MNKLHRDIQIKIENQLFLPSILIMLLFSGPIITFMSLPFFLLPFNPMILTIIINILLNKYFLGQFLVVSLLMIVMASPMLILLLIIIYLKTI